MLKMVWKEGSPNQSEETKDEKDNEAFKSTFLSLEEWIR